MLVRGYFDAYYNNCGVSGKRITGWVITVVGNALSWKSQNHSTVAQSTAEAEYMLCIYYCLFNKECCYLKPILQELRCPVNIFMFAMSIRSLWFHSRPYHDKKPGANTEGEAFSMCLSLGKGLLSKKTPPTSQTPQWKPPNADMFIETLLQVSLANKCMEIGFEWVYWI